MKSLLIRKLGNSIDSLVDTKKSTIIRNEVHEKSRDYFNDILNLNGINSGELFDSIYKEFLSQYNKKQKYHDWYHICLVINNLCEGIKFNQKNGTLNMKKNQINAILIAAAFHDVGHRGVLVPDSVNISKSVVISEEFISKHKLNKNEDIDEFLLYDCIQSTQYPYSKEPNCELHAILRDADLLQILEKTWFEDIYIHMYEEFLDKNPKLDFKEFCVNEKKFILNAKFYSIWWHECIKFNFYKIVGDRVDKVIAAVNSY